MRKYVFSNTTFEYHTCSYRSSRLQNAPKRDMSQKRLKQAGDLRSAEYICSNSHSTQHLFTNAKFRRNTLVADGAAECFEASEEENQRGNIEGNLKSNMTERSFETGEVQGEDETSETPVEGWMAGYITPIVVIG